MLKSSLLSYSRDKTPKQFFTARIVIELLNIQPLLDLLIHLLTSHFLHSP